MDKAHDVERVSFRGTTMLLRVDGKDYELDVSLHSLRLASATLEERKKFVVSPTGYGIHWPDLDEDLSIDGLIGVRRHSPVDEKAAGKPLKDSANAPVK